MEWDSSCLIFGSAGKITLDWFYVLFLLIVKKNYAVKNTHLSAHMFHPAKHLIDIEEILYEKCTLKILYCVCPP
jgi:hypothetical protein